jgi:hypothetical protein
MPFLSRSVNLWVTVALAAVAPRLSIYRGDAQQCVDASDHGMRERYAVCLLAIWAVSASAPSACLADSQSLPHQAGITYRSEFVTYPNRRPKSRAHSADHGDARVAPHQTLHSLAAEDTAALVLRDKAGQDKNSASDANAATQTQVSAQTGVAAAQPTVPDAAHRRQLFSRGAPASEAGEAAGPHLTRSEAHKLLNRTSNATPQLMRRLPPEGKAAMERHRTCGEACWVLAIPFVNRNLQNVLSWPNTVLQM